MKSSIPYKKFLFLNRADNKLRALFILAAVWLGIETVLFLVVGVKVSVDSTVYISNANNLLQGMLPEGRDIWYISYSLFLALVFYLHGSLTTVVIIQILLSGVAAYCIYLLTQEITRDNVASIIGVVLYLGWIKIHQWDIFIYTESFYTSLSIITIALVAKSKSATHYVIAGFLFIFTFFIRPTGFNLLAGLAVYLLSSLRHKKIGNVITFSRYAVFIVTCAILLNVMLKDFTIMESYAKAEVIYPNITFGLEKPDDITLPPDQYAPLHRLFIFALENPVYFIKLSGLKFLLFFGNVKPYFSWLHNLLIVVILYPLYYFAIRGYKLISSSRHERILIVTYVAAQAFTVSLTSENWDGRFLIPILPFIFVLSATGLSPVVKKLWARFPDINQTG